MSTEKKWWKKILLLTGCIFATIGIIGFGQILGIFLTSTFDTVTRKYLSTEFSDAWITGEMYISFIGIWIIMLLVLVIFKKSRPILQTIGTKSSGNTWKNFGIGILVGAGLNGACILVAWLHQDIYLTFKSFRPISFVVIFLCVLVQSSAEELLCRGFLYEKTRQYYKNPMVAVLVNSLLFAVLHLFNDGVTILSVVNIFLSGMLFSFMVLYMNSLWCAFAAHAAWNFTQNILFGLPNSGIVTPYSVFRLEAGSARNSFAYNVGFGIEGTIIADMVLLLACGAFFMWGRKQEKNEKDS